MRELSQGEIPLRPKRKMRTSIAAGLVAAVVTFNASATPTNLSGDLVGHSVVSGMTLSLLPVAGVSLIAWGTGLGVSGATKWSVDKLSHRSYWTVNNVERHELLTRVRLANQKNKDLLELTLPTKTILEHNLHQGETLIIEKKNSETAVLTRAKGEAIAVLADAEGVPHSAPRETK